MAKQRDHLAMEKRRFEAAALFEKGYGPSEVARRLNVRRQSAYVWQALWKTAGRTGLKSNGSAGCKRRLTPEQEVNLTQAIIDGAEATGHGSSVWTLPRIADLIRQQYQVEYHPGHVWRLLRRLGFSCQRPARRAYERDSEEVALWLAEVYPKNIINKSRRRNAHIVFIDEAGFMLAPILRRTWAPRGCTPVLRVSAPHDRISVIGAISISPQSKQFCFYFRLLQDNVNFRGQSVVGFLDELRRKIPGPITVLWDEIPIHRSHAVRVFLRKHRKIVVEEFPPYAPELNPVDYVWAYAKYSRLANYCPPNLNVLRDQITAELRRLKKRHDLLRSFLNHSGLSLGLIEDSES